MKSILFLLPAVASAAVLVERQLGKSLTLAGTSKLEPEVRPESATRVLQRFGPLTLRGKGAKTDSGQQNFMFSFPQNGLCRNCTVLKGRVMLLDANNKPISVRNNSGVYIHHILTFDTTKRGGSFLSGCSSVTAMLGSKFIGSGEDNNNVDVWYTNKRGDHVGGFHIGPSDRFTMNADLVSLNSATSRVYIGFDLEYQKGRLGSDSSETLLTVESCGGGRINANARGPTSTRSGKYTFKENGSIVLAKGHLHAGGDALDININGRLACESKAVYGKKGDKAISEMTVCPSTIKVKKGDVLTFTVNRHESHGLGSGMPDVMGMLDMVFMRGA
jgi:hypothetical protein